MTRQEAIGKAYGMSGTKEQHEALEFLVPEIRVLREFYERQQEKEQRGKIERAPQGDVVTMLLSDTNTSKSDSILSGRADQKPYEPKNWPADKDNLTQEQKPELVRHSPITYTYNSNASRDERLQAALLALLGSDLIQVNDGGYFTKQDLIEWVKKKPSGLSEEDEVMLKGCIRSIEEARDKRYPNECDANISYNREINWLKSLPERFNLQPKQEWSEEDEACIRNLESIIYYDKKLPNDTRVILGKFLSNLRPQPQGTYKQVIHTIFGMLKDKDFYEIQPSHRVSLLNDIRVKCKDAIECAPILDESSWKPSEVCYGPKGDPDPAGVWKPSEEQMKALLNIEGDLRAFQYNDKAKIIAELYEQLKRL